MHFGKDFKCALFVQASIPIVCGLLTLCLKMCGNNRSQTMDYLTQLEQVNSV
ncbi:hypothetical protein GAPWKB11_0068 [Gilliamella apicola]|nr:hypothetical protein [Gilliamella apicola]KFA59325.1 hypothetical protein GAPWKB11_0068 [Gilliamella apicola]